MSENTAADATAQAPLLDIQAIENRAYRLGYADGEGWAQRAAQYREDSLRSDAAFRRTLYLVGMLYLVAVAVMLAEKRHLLDPIFDKLKIGV